MTIALRDDGCNCDSGRRQGGANTSSRMAQSRAARRCCNSGGKNVATAIAETPQGEAIGDLPTVTRAAAEDAKRWPPLWPKPRALRIGAA